MTARFATSLLVLALVLNALLGRIGGPAGLCLGPGHAHPQPVAEPLAACECSHEAPTAALVRLSEDPAHNDNCPCVDIVVAAAEFFPSAREVSLDFPAPAAQPPVAVLDWTPTAIAPPSARSIHRDADPGGHRRCAVILTTRLLI